MKKVLIICSAIAVTCLFIAALYSEKFTKFNKDDWNHRSFRGPYDRRYDMLDDLLKNYHLKGMKVYQLKELLGSSDVEVFTENDTLQIKMNVFTEQGWRPAKTKNLIVYLDKDSVVTSYKVKGGWTH